MLLLDLVEKLIDEAELNEAMASARHFEEPNTLEVFAMYFQAWGRKA